MKQDKDFPLEQYVANEIYAVARGLGPSAKFDARVVQASDTVINRCIAVQKRLISEVTTEGPRCFTPKPNARGPYCVDCTSVATCSLKHVPKYKE